MAAQENEEREKEKNQRLIKYQKHTANSRI
jgi:hypothetical protein